MVQLNLEIVLSQRLYPGKPMYLEVRTWNTRAVRCYEKAGFRVVFEPWHWRYVGVENALAIRASGLSLEEFLAEQKAL